MKTVESLREKGGRAYALAGYGIRWVGGLVAVYAVLLVIAVAWRGVTFVPEMASPFTFGILAIATLAGAQVAPNVAERWGGKKDG